MGDIRATAALMAVLEFTSVDREEFDAWYDTEHLPERLRVPGILSAQRWLASGVSDTSVAFYDLSGLDVLTAPEYRKISGEALSPWSQRIVGKCDSFRYYEARQLTSDEEPSPAGAKGFYVVGMNVEDSFEAEFNAWYDEEHLPRLGALPGVVRARRYEAVQGPHQYFAVYHLDDPSLVGSLAWLEAAETAWTHRVRTRTFDRFKLVCHPFGAFEPDEAFVGGGMQ
ncbi:hypothetical protein ACIHDR_45135 [Nocardia sp. NPDC052278]|uniref:hypothetical protein n=1 Tax=unclassified Nocardia TaxID=2637762 RepID=UPI0036737FE8